MHNKISLLLWAAFSGLVSCVTVPKTAFDAAKVPDKPDYSSLQLWAAHPDKADPADLTPGTSLANLQSDAPVDVFFLYPTSYTGGKPYQKDWNASASNEKINIKTDRASIKYQASAFNGAGRVFAPRYRQAHLHTFFTKKDSASARQALELAYTDTKAAFEYYLEHWNHGRPFIIAGHSQGARHAMFLIQELIEDKALESQLVAAYLVGWPVDEDFYKRLQPCLTPEQTGCFCSWRTYKRKYGLRNAFERNVICTNPLNWSIQEKLYAPRSANTGGVVKPFDNIHPKITDAEVYKGILLARKPMFPGSFLFVRRNYHIGDINLYYMNVRENTQLRTKMFMMR